MESLKKQGRMPVMKPYTLPELRTFVATELGRLKGAQLQEILTNDRGFALAFWKSGTHWLIVDLLPNSPLALVFDDDCPFRKGARGKPMGLFLNSHGRNKIFREAVLHEEQGRVVVLHLSSSEGDCEIELQLIPKKANAVVRAGGKQIFWEKPKELAPTPILDHWPAERSMNEIREGWQLEQKGGAPSKLDPAVQWEKQRQRDLEKKRKALDEIERQLAKNEAALWAQRGEDLKAGAGEMIDPAHSRAWNMEQAFAKAKQLRAKREGTEERQVLLKNEIAALESTTFEKAQLEKRSSAKPVDLLHRAEARGRKLALDGDLVAFMGKSAADNLALLRKARAWDLWMHLRDYPGAHAILHRQRDQKVSDLDLRKVAQWLAKESLGAKAQRLGQKLEVVMAECRFVRPIKGDKLGRVKYQQERHFFVSLSES